MTAQLITLEAPIDAMYLIHKASRAEAGRVKEIVNQLEEGSTLQPFRFAFYTMGYGSRVPLDHGRGVHDGARL